MDYNYFELTLKREANAARGFAKRLYKALGPEPADVFAPSLGYATDQALVLADAKAPTAAILKDPAVVSSQRRLLTATARPAPGAKPPPGGIYVHRWLTIDGDAVDEFVKLSTEAWVGFQSDFETLPYGLFSAEETPDDRRQKQRRMLLMTRYLSLAEWEKSRHSTGETAAAFRRRAQLTRVALPRACTVIPPQAAG